MSGNQKRVGKELTECSTSPPDGTTVRLVDESNLLKWEIVMDGPSESVYAVSFDSIPLLLFLLLIHSS